MTSTSQLRVEPDFEEARKIAKAMAQFGPDRNDPYDLAKHAGELGRAYLALLARVEAAEKRERGIAETVRLVRALESDLSKDWRGRDTAAIARCIVLRLAEHYPEAGAQ